VSDTTIRLTAHLHALIGERHPLSSPLSLRRAEEHLCEQFCLEGLHVTTHQFGALGGIYRNVIGTAVPSAAKEIQEPPLIVAAHFDTVKGSPGADDNASGLAVLLEVAHRLREITLARTVQFIAFSLEEEHLLGSLAYASHLRETNQDILGAIVLECVGYARFEEGSQRTPPGVPITVPSVGNFLAIVGNSASIELTDLVERAARQHLPVIPLVVPGQGELLPDTRRSDHAAFWYYGYPAVMLTDTANFRNPNYHQPTDRLETLNLDFMDQVAAGLTAAVTELAGQKECGAIR
jgi:Zn-dependent M28 family amino/carboxypeptidase